MYTSGTFVNLICFFIKFLLFKTLFIRFILPFFFNFEACMSKSLTSFSSTMFLPFYDSRVSLAVNLGKPPLLQVWLDL